MGRAFFAMKDLLFVSNGQGEDMIACRIVDSIRVMTAGKIGVDGWPMVGPGRAYRERGLSVIGPGNMLPSSGFATLSWRLMISDLRAGWIRTHLRQLQGACRLRRSYRLLVAVGDIVPIAAAVLTRTPFVLVGCAKSAYYGNGSDYNWLERRLLRSFCLMTYPRDSLTAERLAKEGVANRYLGNPMMDELTGCGSRFGLGLRDTVVGMLAGTRSDAEANLIDLLALVMPSSTLHPRASGLRFLFAVRPELQSADIVARIHADERLGMWRPQEGIAADSDAGIVLRLNGPSGMEAMLLKDRFADVLCLSSVVVGMAGTANEQAVGLGIPLITVPARGVQGKNYVRMKMRYFGDAAVSVEHDPWHLSRLLCDLLADPARCRRMGAAGRERMGLPGAGAAIAGDLLQILGETAGEGR